MGVALPCTGHAFVMVGDATQPFVVDVETGLLGQFRHQYFLLGLIARFHKAALLMLSDRLMGAVGQLDITSARSIVRFQARIRQTLEIFLRFTHRFWFHEVSLQTQAKTLFDLWRRHLETEALYAEVRQEVTDMAQYLDSDGLRRQASTVVRLTVVTTFGPIGTLTTGFLGMNLLEANSEPMVVRALIFFAVFVPTAILTLLTVRLSKSLSDFLENLSNRRSRVSRNSIRSAVVWYAGIKGRWYAS